MRAFLAAVLAAVRGAVVGMVLAWSALVGAVPAGGAEMGAQGEPPAEPDEQFAVIARQVPGFGGAWVEGDALVGEEETLHLWLTEPSEDAAGEARALLVDLLGERFDQESVVVHRADFSWDQLETWFDAAIDVLSLPGAAWLDIDETRNRVSIGMEDPERHGPAARELLDQRGIPRDAVVIEPGSPPALQIPPGENPWTGALGYVLLGVAVVGIGALAIWGLARRRRRRHLVVLR